jgi:hypothetical protein
VMRCAPVTPPAAAPDDLGAHMSIAGGLHRALERGAALGCSAVQIFLKNQRQWAARPMEQAEVRAFRRARRATGIRPVFAHSSYLINLCSPVPVAWGRRSMPSPTSWSGRRRSASPASSSIPARTWAADWRRGWRA